jgi:hypothetical protein
MISRYLFIIATIVLASCDATQQTSYRSGSKEVSFTLDYLDDNGSTLACVNLTKGFDDETYNGACFGRKLNERGVYQGCQLSFDGENCNKCQACDINGEVGLMVDCYNIRPTKNIEFCKLFTNNTVQTLLAGDTFASVAFDFALNISAPKNTTTGGGGSSGTNLSNVIRYCTMVAMSVLVMSASIW